jgi:hypothetical protein
MDSAGNQRSTVAHPTASIHATLMTRPSQLLER